MDPLGKWWMFFFSQKKNQGAKLHIVFSIRSSESSRILTCMERPLIPFPHLWHPKNQSTWHPCIRHKNYEGWWRYFHNTVLSSIGFQVFCFLGTPKTPEKVISRETFPNKNIRMMFPVCTSLDACDQLQGVNPKWGPGCFDWREFGPCFGGVGSLQKWRSFGF